MTKGWKLPKDSRKSLSPSSEKPKETPSPTKAAALSYDPATADAPRVVAAGQGFIAERILEIAQASGISVRRDADLMSILSAVEVNSTIPLEAFAAVAEILSYVYRSTGKIPSQTTSSSDEGTPS